MTSLKNIIFLLCILSFTPFTALANDGWFGGSGSTPMPLQHTEIQMVSEHIVIEVSDEKHWPKLNVGEGVTINCDFTFLNTSDKPVTIDIGFPYPVIDEESPVVDDNNNKAGTKWSPSFCPVWT